jgi:hypothetical protein
MGRQLAFSVAHVADWWMSAWVEAGQPMLRPEWGADSNKTESMDGEDEEDRWKGGEGEDHEP